MKVPSHALAVLLPLVLFGCGGTTPSASPSTSAVEPTPTTPTASSAATASPSAAPVRTTGHIQVDGMDRTYLLATPPDVAGRDPLPLLLALHGWTQTMNDAEEISGFDAMATDPGAVIVYPQGYGQSWNAGACCKPANVEGVDDVKFLGALIDQLEREYPVDPNRVFVLGGSNGGEMAERLGCELSGRIGAIADVIGTLLTDCQPSQPVSVIAIHGTADTAIPIDGSSTGCQDAACPAFADVMERWRQLDGCTGDPTVTDDAYTTTTSWAGCADATALTFIAAKDRGHDWYVAHPDDRAVTWAFFMAHPRSDGSSQASS
jgi:polyhydroxybutyrate depolymerase